MVGNKVGIHTLCWLAAGAASLSVACAGDAVSAGEEGSTINLSRCYGVDCGRAPQSFDNGEDDAGEPCIENGLALEERFDFEGAGSGITLRRVLPAPDGSFWALGVTAADPRTSDAQNVLLHYSSEGALLQISDVLEAGAGHASSTDCGFGIDAEGNVSVAVYGAYAPTADSEVAERLRLFTFNASFEPVGDSLLFSGIASARLATDPTGSLMLAGNATGNAAHGVLTRLVEGAPSWIQTNVPTSGQGVAAGVSGLVVDEAGASTVLAQRSGRWDGGPDVSKFGLASFDAEGNPLWDLPLPMELQGGHGMALAVSSGGDFVVSGMRNMESMVIRSVSGDGELGWTFNARAISASVVVDPTTGRTFALGVGNLLQIDAEGRSCAALKIPSGESELQIISGDLAVQEPYAYITAYDHVRRYRLPSE